VAELPAGARDFLLIQNVCTSCGTLPASYSVSTVDDFPWHKSAGMWIWPTHFHNSTKGKNVLMACTGKTWHLPVDLCKFWKSSMFPLDIRLLLIYFSCHASYMSMFPLDIRLLLIYFSCHASYICKSWNLKHLPSVCVKWSVDLSIVRLCLLTFDPINPPKDSADYMHRPCHFSHSVSMCSIWFSRQLFL